jgi:hypothetical protein
VAAFQALPDDERSSWLQALALLIPPDCEQSGLSLAEAARALMIPEQLLEMFIAAM